MSSTAQKLLRIGLFSLGTKKNIFSRNLAKPVQSIFKQFNYWVFIDMVAS